MISPDDKRTLERAHDILKSHNHPGAVWVNAFLSHALVVDPTPSSTENN